MNPINQDEINGILWRACDTFRGTVDPAEYKNYILVMLFAKCISDVWRDRYEQLMQRYGGDEERVARALRYEHFELPADCDFRRPLPRLRHRPRIFLRKVGGGYIFVHRLLQDYFASLENNHG